jgi:hypothetical protein
VIVAGVAVGVLVLALTLTLGVHRVGPTATAPTAGVTGPDVVSLAGTGDIRFGQTAEELAQRHGLRAVPDACMPRFTDPAYVHPILVDGRLAILTLEPPARTPEGVAVGAGTATVRRTYPGATELAPPHPYAYSGLLSTSGEVGYLFLCSDGVVRKVLVGYTGYLKQVFEAGFPTC